jgi:hypothetical protein
MSAGTIKFRRLELPVSIDGRGCENVPFKSICDAIGLNWRTQKRKILNNDHYYSLFCVSLMPARGHQVKPVYLLRLDRVMVFFNTLNPMQIAAQGNRDAANWLLNHQYEWQATLNHFESSKAQLSGNTPTHRQASLPIQL